LTDAKGREVGWRCGHMERLIVGRRRFGAQGQAHRYRPNGDAYESIPTRIDHRQSSCMLNTGTSSFIETFSQSPERAISAAPWQGPSPRVSRRTTNEGV
jgi:hypothetical protein